MLSRDEQFQMLFRLWEEGAYDTAFYREKLSACGLGGIRVDSPEQFRRLPLTTKEDLRAFSAVERRACRPEDVISYFTSSGTTGTKTVYAFSKEDKRRQEAVTRALYSPLGLGPGDLGLVAVPVGSGNMGHSMIWQYTVMGAAFYCVNTPSLEEIRFALENLPVTTISTLPSLAVAMDDSEEDRAIAANAGVKRLLIGGDAMSPSRRRAIERLYSAKCYNSFGMSELFGPIANECPVQGGMHFCDDTLFIEVLDPDTLEEVPEGETGIAVYTSLWRKGSPLLRYLSDDLVSVSREPCACGSALPRLYHKGRYSFTCRNRANRIISPYDVEMLLDSFSYEAPYHIDVLKNGSYILHLVDEIENQRLLLEKLEQLLQGVCTLQFDQKQAYEYKNHCFYFE